MATYLKTSPFKNLEEYINSVISEVLSNTWTVEDQDIQKQILKSKNSLISFQSNLVSASTKYEEKFSFKSVKCFLHLLIDDFTRWTIMKEILKVFYNCFIQQNDLEKWNILREFQSSKYKFYLYKLLDFLEVYGDYDFQILILKVITVIYGKYDASLAQEFIPESADLQHALMKITKHNFIIPAREFLHIVNKRKKNIFSIRCRHIMLGSIWYKDNGDGLWIDFNKIDKCASWYIEKGEETNSELEEYNNFSHLIFLFNQNVDSIKVVRSLCKTIQIIFKLKEPCWSYDSEYQDVIEKERELKIVLDYSAEAEDLIHTILPGINCNLYFEKKRKLVDESEDVTRLFRETKCNKHRRGSASPISTNTSNTSISLIDSIKDTISLFDTTDIDDVEVHFHSQDQLVKMAQDLEAFKSLMNSLSGIDGDKNNVENKKEVLHTETTLVGFNTSDENMSIRDPYIQRLPRRLKQEHVESKKINESIHKLNDTSQHNTESGKENINEPIVQNKTCSKTLLQDTNSIQIYNENTSSKEQIHTQGVASSVLKDVFQPNIQAAKITAEISKPKKRRIDTEEKGIKKEIKIKKGKNKHIIDSTSSESSTFVEKYSKTKEKPMENTTRNKKFQYNYVIKTTSSESLIFSNQSELSEPERDDNKKRKKSKKNVEKSFKSKENRTNKKNNKTNHSLSVEAQETLFKIKSFYATMGINKESRQPLYEKETFKKLHDKSKLCETKNKSKRRKNYDIDTSKLCETKNKSKRRKSCYIGTSKLCETKNKSKRKKSYDRIDRIDVMRDESEHIYGEDDEIASIENLVLPKSKCDTPPPHFLSQTEYLRSTAPKWTTRALLNGIEFTLSSNEFIGKSLFIIYYNFDISCVSPKYYSDITEHNMRAEEFQALDTNLLFCTKGPNTDISEWMKTFENPEIVQNLNVPLVVDYQGKFMSGHFHVTPNCNCLKSSVLLDNKGNVVYKSASSFIGDVVDVEHSLKLIRRAPL